MNEKARTFSICSNIRTVYEYFFFLPNNVLFLNYQLVEHSIIRPVYDLFVIFIRQNFNANVTSFNSYQ